MSSKHLRQKQRKGREFWKETIMIPFFVIGFVGWLLWLAAPNSIVTALVYQKHSLPPLSTSAPWGIFNVNSNGNTENILISKHLYYSPNNHAGVQNLIDELVATFPNVKATGAASPEDVIDQYEVNLFDTWAALEFTLTADQLSTGLLITDPDQQNVVTYNILVNPNVAVLSNDNTTDQVFNKVGAESDAYWATGYMTLQNFVSTYLAREFPTVSPDYSVETFVQRYPRSPVYDNENADVNLAAVRWSIWKWIAPTVLSICMFIPMLSMLTECVRERQFRMKDLLEISGLMNPSYWFSYVVTIFAVNQLTIWVISGFMQAFNITTIARLLAYVAILTVYTLGLSTCSLLAGFLIFRSEYYGLPIFIANSAITIGGCFLGFAYSMPTGVKLFLCFLHPSIGLTMGIFVIETYIYHNLGADSVDYSYADSIKNYPSLNAIMGVMLVSALVYFLITLGMPFDWLSRWYTNPVEAFLVAKDEMAYPCDSEEEANPRNDPTVLKVKDLSHIYPDGTHAVKDISFNIKQGEVLSFLGANGAGKSTSMGMLCGTLNATFGDANVNGYSITHQRTMARRNLGIAMQQDIIWDDISVEDHLFLFGSLRGVFGAKLRDEVDKMVESLGFPEKRKSLAGTLSGGQKRRLCVGISMVGGNSVVYLDEPTAGLDPVSRRQLWELVQKNRAGRAILLTTHFMDEADVLGDRIAIVKDGRLRALGTSKFLKKRFGLGYLLKMSLTSTADVDRIVTRIAAFVPETSVASNAGTELSLRLPKETVGQFPVMLEALETESNNLGVLSYGIETTTLEEVFMRIVNEDTEQLMTDHAEANRLLTASYEERAAASQKLQERDEKRNPLDGEQIDALLTKGSPANQILSQVAIMFQKRFYQFARSKGQWSMGLVAPVLIALAASAIVSKMPNGILADPEDIYAPTYSNFYSTPLSGPAASATEMFTAAFGFNDTVYVGPDYDALNTYVSDIAGAGVGATSTAGIYYESISNFTVMYNASFPLNFAGVVTNMLNAATSNATAGNLVVESSFQQLPQNEFNQQINSCILISLLVAVFAGSLGAGMSIVVGGERVTQVKHQQLASGASKLAYWVANFMFDFIVMFIGVLLFGMMLAIFAPDDFTGSGYGIVLVGGLPFIVSAIFRFYIVSFWVADIKMAQTIYFYGSLFIMFMLLAIWCNICFNEPANGNAMLPSVQGTTAALSFLDPAFGFFLIIMFQHNFIGVLTQNPGKDFLTDIAAMDFYFLILGAIFYCLVLFMMEGGWDAFKNFFFCCFRRGAVHPSATGSKNPAAMDQALLTNERPSNERYSTVNLDDDSDAVMRITTGNEMTPMVHTEHPAMRIRGAVDPDVLAEREKVKHIVESGTLSAQNNAIFISSLKKIYYGKGSAPTKIAVRDVSVSIQHGEVFGLLGANGAGKTTLLKMVSGQEQPSSGFALINGYDVVRNTSEAQRSMGLCPQFDTLVERLTVRENLLFFGQIKGLSGLKLIEVCEAFMAAMNIKRYENKLIQQLSGGNRRKVSLAVALLGAPPTVYLDEPSTGLDPVASRLMWRLLTKISAMKSTAIVLTTHNMLECEAVCTRICIMKLGEMVCLGDSQHLRSAHGTGFLLEMTLSSPEMTAKAKHFVMNSFAHASVVDEHVTMINFEIPRSSIARLSQAFKQLEAQKADLGIVDYALSQSTLEQVFLKQIRPNDNDQKDDEDQRATERVPLAKDYAYGYFMWALAAVVPGLHHFYLGNTARGFKYLFTFNEVFAGWLLDGLEMHVLIQKSVQQYGHTSGCCGCYKHKDKISASA